MNEYVSVTVWKHSKPIDWPSMQEMLTETLKLALFFSIENFENPIRNQNKNYTTPMY